MNFSYETLVEPYANASSIDVLVDGIFSDILGGSWEEVDEKKEALEKNMLSERKRYVIRFYSELVALCFTVICFGLIITMGKSMLRKVFSMKCGIQIIINALSFMHCASSYAYIQRVQDGSIPMDKISDTVKRALTGLQQCFTLILIHELYKMMIEVKIRMTQIFKKTLLALVAIGLAYGADKALQDKCLRYYLTEGSTWRILLDQLNPFIYLLVFLNTFFIFFYTYKLIASIQKSRRFQERIAQQNGTKVVNHFSFLVATVAVMDQCFKKDTNFLRHVDCMNDSENRMSNAAIFMKVYLSYVSETLVITALIIYKRLREWRNAGATGTNQNND